MSIPANVGKTVIRGTGVGSEIWQTGFWWARPDTLDMADLAEFKLYTADIKPTVDGFWSSNNAKIYTSYSYPRNTSYWYRGGAGAALGADNSAAGVAGSLATNGAPVDTCCVLSLITETAGRRGRGRMYLPRHEACTVGTGLFASDASSYVNAFAAVGHNVLLQTHPVQLRVVSQADGVARPLNTIRADMLPDVQRRRENRMAKGTVTSVSVPF